MSEQVWAPLLESNQGTLSLLALVAALSVAVGEYIANNAREATRQQEEIDDTIELFNEAADTLHSLGDAETQEERDNHVEEVGLFVNALQGLASAHMKRPLLALACLRGAQVLKEGLVQGHWETDSESASALYDRFINEREKAAMAVRESRQRKGGRARAKRMIDKALKRVVRESGQDHKRI